MDIQIMLKTLILAGKISIESGAEITRVDDTIHRIGYAYKMDEVNTMITPTTVLISLVKGNQTYSKVLGVRGRNLNLNKINQVNSLSRNCTAQKISLEEAYAQLLSIDKQPNYPNKVQYLASGLMAMFFCLFFGGNLLDGICAFCIGFLIQILKLSLQAKDINPTIKEIILSITFTFLALVLVKLGIANSQDSIITGNLMLLVPGLAMINAVRDSIAGDTVSGVVRGFEAGLTALALVVGVGGTLAIWTNIMGG